MVCPFHYDIATNIEKIVDSRLRANDGKVSGVKGTTVPLRVEGGAP